MCCICMAIKSCARVRTFKEPLLLNPPLDRRIEILSKSSVEILSPAKSLINAEALIRCRSHCCFSNRVDALNISKKSITLLCIASEQRKHGL